MVAPDDESALKWAKEDYIREQVHRQRLAYLETQARRRAEEGGVIVIDSDDEGEAGPSSGVGDSARDAAGTSQARRAMTTTATTPASTGFSACRWRWRPRWPQRLGFLVRF